MKTIQLIYLFIATVAVVSCEQLDIDPDNDDRDQEVSVTIAGISPEATYVKTALEVEANVSLDTLTDYAVRIGNQSC